ncbi:MAG: guanylate kinase [Actinobacteria bacterium]|nr:guanylate kinase [Actinomycetota bacterium]
MGAIAVLSGPGGVGKGTMIARLRDRLAGWTVAVSATTRAPREGERDGMEYHFVSDDEFDRLIADGALLEWARFGGNRYGTLWDSVRGPLADDRCVLLELEIHGALAVRKEFPEATLIFLHPPSLDALTSRLRQRGTDDDRRVAERMALAEWELAQADAFDHHVTNDDLDAAAAQIVRILVDAAGD